MDIFSSVAFPARGIDLQSGFAYQRQGTTPEGINIRVYEPRSRRGKGGSRGGLSRFINQTVGSLGGPVQHLAVLVDPTQDALLDADYVLGFGIGGADGDNFGGGGFPYPTGLGPWPDPPAGFVYDTSTAGPANLWGLVTTGLGVNSRNPGRLIRDGGSGVQPGKNTTTAKIVPTINWSTPAPVANGTVLSGTQLNAAAVHPTTLATVAGTFYYDPAAGEVPASNSIVPLNTLFVPTDTRIYAYNTKTVNLTVGSVTGINFIQATGDFISWDPALTTSISKSFTSDVTAGSLLLVFVLPGTVDISAVAVSDSLGNSYTFVAEAFNPLGLATAGNGTLLFRTITTLGGPCTITCSYTMSFIPGIVASNIGIIEYSGVDILTPLDGTSTNNNVSSTAVSTGNIAVNFADSLAIGGFIAVGSGLTVDPAYTQRLSAGVGVAIWDKIGAGIGNTNVSGTISPAARWWAVGASFKKQ